jgi:hypothetical protein
LGFLGGKKTAKNIKIIRYLPYLESFAWHCQWCRNYEQLFSLLFYMEIRHFTKFIPFDLQSDGLASQSLYEDLHSKN